MDFNLGESSYEAGGNIYDSGGPVFIDNNGEWALTGIILYRNGTNPYTGNYAAMIHDYSAWIKNTMDAVTGDDDFDGIPNWWEQQFGTDIVASVDQDGDGMTGEQEYIADTNPTNAASFFEIENFIALTNQTLYFTGSTSRQYQLFYTTNDLADSNLVWAAAHSNRVWGTGSNSSITVTNTESKAFYRLKAILP
ncbi:MAG: hypothetical protein AB7E95_02880 [Kiritimatiellales bacterium]